MVECQKDSIKILVQGVLTDETHLKYVELQQNHIFQGRTLHQQKKWQTSPNVFTGFKGASCQGRDISCKKTSLPKTGLIFIVEEFKAPPSIKQCFHRQGFRH